MKTKKWLSLLLAMALISALLAGCGSANAPTDTSASPESTGESEVSAESNVTETSEPGTAPDAEPSVDSLLPADYPMIAPDGVTITAFQQFNPTMSNLNDYNDLPWWQEVSKRTGIKFQWTMVSPATSSEQFNLLVAAAELPALVCTASLYNDGIASAIENEVFVDLSDYLDEYAPDYKAFTMQDGIRQSVYNEFGQITCFHQLSMKAFPPNNGVFFRGDLLEAQGLDVPVTYDQYEDVLLKLKDAYDIEAPIFQSTDNYTWLSAGKGVKLGFSLNENGECIYGPIEEGYRDYLSEINQWYEEGLFYKDFYVIPSGEIINYALEYMSSGKSVAVFTYNESAGSIMLNEGQKLVAGHLPRDNEDQQVHLTDGQQSALKVSNSVMFAISTNATVEEAQNLCMMLNYFYTEEGELLANYGVEGQSFEYQGDGTPWYTDLIIENPDGLSQTQALLHYVGYMVPAYADYTKYNISSLTKWKDFLDVWSSADNYNDFPQVNLTTEETEEYSNLSSDVDTYLDEVLVKFIIGDMDINDDAVWEDYLSKLEGLGVQTMIKIYSDALERYINA